MEMNQDEIHERSKHVLQHLKRHVEEGGFGVHINELTKALNLSREETYSALEFLASQGLITYKSEGVFKLTLKGMVW